MATWLIFGASRGIGALLAELAVERQHRVIALVRKKEDAERLRQQNISVIIGDACDADSVIRVCEKAGKEAIVVSTMGGQSDYLAHRTVIDCAEKTGMTQMLMVTSLGCGDGWPGLSARAKQAFGQAVREKSLAESWLQTSTLAWCIVRPGGLMSGPASGKGQLLQQPEVHGMIRRADVALAIADLLAKPLQNQIYSLIEPGLKPQAR